ncbi:hemagglutinin protein [Winogradskyella maritima]|uniref:Hemagglutinin protein n=1 Tax=Winogradskyella maritima TaxID=1517766 RepID=A0ABV8AFL8_9FLAO|nr:hemagglutinin protein [Winogradskyella maritima]
MKLTSNLFTLILFGVALNAQTLEKSSIDSGGSSTNASGIAIVYTIGEVAVQESSTGGVSRSEGFIGEAPKLNLSAKVYLQGPLLNPDTPTLMNDNLRSLGLIPTTSPYSDNATCEATVFNTTGNGAIVDWVWLTLRSKDNTSSLINGRSALLRRDGSIVDVDGVTPISLRAYQNTYYLAIEHRNHLGVMNESPMQFSSTSITNFDTTNPSFSTFGTNAVTTLPNLMGSNALWAGDVNSNGQIRYLGPGNDTNTIKDAVLANSSNATSSNFFPFSAYSNADINMNGQVRYLGPGNDTNILKDIILGHPSNGTTSNFFPFISQIPNINQ